MRACEGDRGRARGAATAPQLETPTAKAPTAAPRTASWSEVHTELRATCGDDDVADSVYGYRKYLPARLGQSPRRLARLRSQMRADSSDQQIMEHLDWEA